MKDALFSVRLNLVFMVFYLVFALVSVVLGQYLLAVMMTVLAGVYTYTAKVWWDVYRMRREMDETWTK